MRNIFHFLLVFGSRLPDWPLRLWSNSFKINFSFYFHRAASRDLVTKWLRMSKYGQWGTGSSVHRQPLQRQERRRKMGMAVILERNEDDSVDL